MGHGVNMNELIKLMGLNNSNIVGEHLRFSCCAEFEPHSRATEDFEIIWKLELPKVQYHWMSTKGWVIGKAGLTMRFNGRTIDECVVQAVNFLKETPHKNIYL